MCIRDRIYCDVRNQIAAQVERIQTTAKAIAKVDVFASLALVAERSNYVRPKINEQGVIDIKDGRHPVVEKMIPNDMFISNDTYLDDKMCIRDRDKTKTAQYWMVGSLSGASWEKVKYVAAAFLITVCIILLFTRELDMLLLGDGTAENLGVNVTRIKMVVIIMAAVLTGIVVSVSGVIGFIGLVRCV